MVRPHLEYRCTVWSPHQQNQIKQVEMVQRREARFVSNRYRNTSSVQDMLTNLNWENLATRRKKIQLTLLYKITNNLIDINPNDYLQKTNSRTRASHQQKYLPYSTKTDCYKHSFFPNTIPLWNRLPASVAEAPSLASFKKELSNLTF